MAERGAQYTLPEFETKAKNFEKSYLKKGLKRALTGLEVETLYWKANGDKPFSVEYATDYARLLAFVPVVSNKKKEKQGRQLRLGKLAWNMRGVSRAKGSLLRFMKEEIPALRRQWCMWLCKS